jgi:hypothetical protein
MSKTNVSSKNTELTSEIKPIKIKKHGRRAMSIFKYELSRLAKFFLNADFQNNTHPFQFLSCA